MNALNLDTMDAELHDDLGFHLMSTGVNKMLLGTYTVERMDEHGNPEMVTVNVPDEIF